MTSSYIAAWVTAALSDGLATEHIQLRLSVIFLSITEDMVDRHLITDNLQLP